MRRRDLLHPLRYVPGLSRLPRAFEALERANRDLSSANSALTHQLQQLQSATLEVQELRTVLQRLLFSDARELTDDVLQSSVGEADALPVPAGPLRFLVGGLEDVNWFLTSGKDGAQTLVDVLSRQGQTLDHFERILDFGCGCGRVLRHLHSLKTAALHGTDANRLAIQWCETHLTFARFSCCLLEPPLPYRAGMFDLIYAFSVLTHLTEGLQHRWMDEMRRVLAPGGLLILSLHGQKSAEQLSSENRWAYDQGSLVVVEPAYAGMNTCAAFHPDSYVREVLARGFDVVDFIPEGARGNPPQDVYVLRSHRDSMRRIVQPAVSVSEGGNAAFGLWGGRARERRNPARPIVAWTDSPVVARHYIHPSISGDGDVGWFDWVGRRFLTVPAEVALSVGSGDGSLERHGLSAGFAKHFEAFDASSGAVDLARQLAQEHHVDDRVRYFVADLNRDDFISEPARYDVAFASAAVHHLRELEHFFSQVRRSLKPGALFIVNEFVGPNQFQWTDLQLRLADELLLRIPERYRRSLLSGHVKIRNIRQPLAHMNAVDPSEAIRSSDIVPLMRIYFDLVEQVDYGGTLLNLVLEEIAGNFSDTPEDLAVLRPLFDTEREYLQRGVIPSDFAVIVARNRPIDSER